MSLNIRRAACAIVFAAASAAIASAQTAGGSTVVRGPSSPIRPYVVTTAQSVDEAVRRLHPQNKVEELVGGAGMELRVAIQHEADRPAPAAEIHDASDDVYYVLEGSAVLTLGGRLEAPKEVEPGEWRGPRIDGGQSFEVKKGDLVVVPRGTPHMRSTAGKDFAMILIKVFDKPLPPPPAKAAPAPKTQRP